MTEEGGEKPHPYKNGDWVGCSGLIPALHQADFVVRQVVELVDEGINGAVDGFNLAGELLQFLGVVGGGAACVQGEDLLHQRHHAAVQGGFGGVAEVDSADG